MVPSTLGIAKLAVSYVVGTSVSHTVKEVISNNVQPETTAEVAKVIVGRLVIGTMAAAAATGYVTKNIDETVESWKEFQAKKNEIKEDKPEETE